MSGLFVAADVAATFLAVAVEDTVSVAVRAVVKVAMGIGAAVVALASCFHTPPPPVAVHSVASLGVLLVQVLQKKSEANLSHKSGLGD